MLPSPNNPSTIAGPGYSRATRRAHSTRRRRRYTRGCAWPTTAQQCPCPVRRASQSLTTVHRAAISRMIIASLPAHNNKLTALAVISQGDEIELMVPPVPIARPQTSRFLPRVFCNLHAPGPCASHKHLPLPPLTVAGDLLNSQPALWNRPPVEPVSCAATYHKNCH